MNLPCGKNPMANMSYKLIASWIIMVCICRYRINCSGCPIKYQSWKVRLQNKIRNVQRKAAATKHKPMYRTGPKPSKKLKSNLTDHAAFRYNFYCHTTLRCQVCRRDTRKAWEHSQEDCSRRTGFMCLTRVSIKWAKVSCVWHELVSSER